MFERCGLSQSTVSAHLAVLQRAGLVRTRSAVMVDSYEEGSGTGGGPGVRYLPATAPGLVVLAGPSSVRLFCAARGASACELRR